VNPNRDKTMGDYMTLFSTIHFDMWTTSSTGCILDKSIAIRTIGSY